MTNTRRQLTTTKIPVNFEMLSSSSCVKCVCVRSGEAGGGTQSECCRFDSK